MSDWIKCSERLPEDGAKIILHSVCGTWPGEVFVNQWGWLTFESVGGILDQSDWIAWMPMPAPPEEG